MIASFGNITLWSVFSSFQHEMQLIAIIDTISYNCSVERLPPEASDCQSHQVSDERQLQ